MKTIAGVNTLEYILLTAIVCTGAAWLAHQVIDYIVPAFNSVSALLGG